jgi:hypothetical protein
LEFFFDQSLENFLLGHVHAFHDWGGAPRSLQLDFVPGNRIIVLCPSPFCSLAMGKALEN